MAKKSLVNKIQNRDTSSIYDGSIDLSPEELDIIDGTSDGITQVSDGVLAVKNIEIHRTGLQFVGDVSEDEYAIFGNTLLQIETAYQWIIGDYLAYGVDNNYGMAQHFAEQLGRDEATIHDWTYVCRQVEFSERSENLSFAHHKVVATLSPEDQVYWLNFAEAGDADKGKSWSASRLRKEIAKAQGESLAVQKTVPAYQRWSEQSDERASIALSKFRAEKDGRKRKVWQRYIESEVERWQAVLEEMNNS